MQSEGGSVVSGTSQSRCRVSHTRGACPHRGAQSSHLHSRREKVIPAQQGRIGEFDSDAWHAQRQRATRDQPAHGRDDSIAGRAALSPYVAASIEYAGGHHERMDGTGYPKGIFAADMSIPARIMAIADVFEALTAQDRPYKRGLRLSESMEIMGQMKRDNHLDPQLFDLFVKRQVYRTYAKHFLPEELIDHVDEGALLAIEPKGFDVPPAEERRKRMKGFLNAYSE